MSELRLTGKSPDGLNLVLGDSEGAEFTLPISEALRTTINAPHLASVPSASVPAGDELPTISVKEIQRRLRSGETMESIAQDGNISVAKVERFSSPILQERIYILNLSFAIAMRKESAREATNFQEVVFARLRSRGVDLGELAWNTWRLGDATWTITLNYPNRDGHGVATWNFDMTRRALSAQDENARWMIGDEPAIAPPEAGLIYSPPSHPSRFPETSPINSPVVRPVRETPRLVALRDAPTAPDISDGITGRAKVPSWDEIMFGRAATPDNDPEE